MTNFYVPITMVHFLFLYEYIVTLIIHVWVWENAADPKEL